MRNRILFLFVCIILSAQVFAQTAPDTLWTKTFGGSEYDCARSVKQTVDGGFIIAGHTESYGMGLFDCWLIKTDEDGNEEWNHTYGGVYYDYAFSTQQTIDCGYIIAGFTYSYGSGESDFWLVKTDENGNEEWNHTYGGVDYDHAHSVQQTTDGGYIIAGNTTSYGAGLFDCWLIKTDENGNEEWDHTYGGVGDDFANSVKQTVDGGFIIAGHTDSYGMGLFDFWLIKTDENGNEEWNLTYGGIDDDYASSVQQTVGAGYVVTGFTYSYGAGESDFWLVKTDENGNEEWNQTYGGIDDDRAYSVQQTQDEGFIIAGTTNSFGVGNYDCWLIKTDENGDEEWNQIYDFDSFDKARSVQQTTDGGYIIAGYGYCVGNIYDAWLIRLGSDVSIVNNTIAESLISNLSNYPNPFNPSTTISFSVPVESNIELSIYNIKGQRIKSLANESFESGNYSIVWNGDDDLGNSVSSGIYLYNLKVDGKNEAVKKCLLLK